MISLTHNLIFIHIPKTAGTSIRKWILDFTNDPVTNLLMHVTISDLEKVIVPDFFQSCYKFCVVRNTWDRFVSLYHHEKPNKTFKDWLYNYEDSQLRYIKSLDGTINLDYIGRFEKLPETISVLSNNFQSSKIPDFQCLNVGEHLHYSWYYTEELVQLVYTRCREEIDMFGFEFQKLEII